ncbi:MAG: dienelactone hydrolase family protein [Rhodospirillaceae bacterium]|nr:dienelactone hydrolase family protein [Rhodospirillaceae bacterium]MYB13771.1 dienelactone hydrolase family protein [Rhodospirillaceae bacterium]MYI50542.1 dienelactone hydrolase family protein [Rhodospirillaceae bacterium]
MPTAPVSGETVAIEGPDGKFDAYLARPAQRPAPGLVLMQYICGVNAVMRRLADGFAGHGYLVACPDLFWRQEPGVQLIQDPSKPDPAEQQRALDLNAGFDDAAATADLNATIDWLRGSPDCTGRAGALGYCLGGRLAFLTAARSDADCSVGYYGVNIDRYLGEAGTIASPLMLHIAGADELCSQEAHDAIVGTLDPLDAVTLHEYEGAGHAFALEGGHNYRADAAALANARSLAFLQQHLNGA